MNTPMKNLSLGLLSALALGMLACGSPSGMGSQTGPDTPPVVTPNDPLPEPLVQYNIFRPEKEEDLLIKFGEGEFKGKPMVNYGYLIARTTLDFDHAAFAKHGLEIVGSFAANGSRYFYLHKESDLVETMKRLNRADGMLYIEPDIMHYTTAGFEYKPGDPYVNNSTSSSDPHQYGVLTTMAKKAWETYGFGTNKPVVADFDTGVRWQHEDLTGVVTNAFSWYGTASGAALLTTLGDLTEAGGPLNDPNPPDRMTDTSPNASGTDLSSGHGTHTAGTIAATGNNGKGVAGMCWNVKLVSYKVLSDGGSGGSWAVYGSLWHLARWKNENVDAEGKPTGDDTGTPRYPHTIPVNFSLGGGMINQFGADMAEMALQHGIVMICSSGNDCSGFQTWPGGLQGTIRVGAVNFNDRRYYYSNWGPNMSVMAPGINVLSTGRSNNTNYAYMGGTSMSAPHVTGLVGYMLTFAPDLTPAQIKTYLEKNADPIEGQTGFDPRYGYGRINAYKTIGAVIADQGKPAPGPDDYVMSPVKVTVKNKAGVPQNGATVYLYKCNASGTIQNYVNVSVTGKSFFSVRDSKTTPPEDGVARFDMLRPGYYKMATSYSVYSIADAKMLAGSDSTPVFEVRQGGTVAPQSLTIDLPTSLWIQTMGTANTARRGDTVISFWNSLTGAPLINKYDSGSYDSYEIVMPQTPGQYWLAIGPYSGSYYGEYALWLGNQKSALTTAPGTYANAGEPDTPGADGIKSLHALDRATAQPINVNDKFVYGDMSAATGGTGGHYYVFTVPAQ